MTEKEAAPWREILENARVTQLMHSAATGRVGSTLRGACARVKLRARANFKQQLSWDSHVNKFSARESNKQSRRKNQFLRYTQKKLEKNPDLTTYATNKVTYTPLCSLKRFFKGSIMSSFVKFWPLCQSWKSWVKAFQVLNMILQHKKCLFCKLFFTATGI